MMRKHSTLGSLWRRMTSPDLKSRRSSAHAIAASSVSFNRPAAPRERSVTLLTPYARARRHARRTKYFRASECRHAQRLRPVVVVNSRDLNNLSPQRQYNDVRLRLRLR